MADLDLRLDKLEELIDSWLKSVSKNLGELNKFNQMTLNYNQKISKMNEKMA